MIAGSLDCYIFVKLGSFTCEQSVLNSIFYIKYALQLIVFFASSHFHVAR